MPRNAPSPINTYHFDMMIYLLMTVRLFILFLSLSSAVLLIIVQLSNGFNGVSRYFFLLLLASINHLKDDLKQFLFRFVRLVLVYPRFRRDIRELVCTSKLSVNLFMQITLRRRKRIGEHV